MELYQAAEDYQASLSRLRDKFIPGVDDIDDAVRYSNVWLVSYSDYHDGYYLHNNIFSREVFDMSNWSEEDHRNVMFITKQRGGIRYFKTIDAVFSALQQIGQNMIVFED